MIMYLDTLRHPAQHRSLNNPLPEYQTSRRPKLSELLTLSSDELVPSPNHLAQREVVSDKGRLLKHPFFTHMPKNAVFPVFTLDKTTSINKGFVAQTKEIQHGERPFAPLTSRYPEKSRGGRWLHEVQLPHTQSANTQWIEWQEIQNTAPPDTARLYPIPPKLNTPNDSRPNSKLISPRQMEILRNIQKEQWLSTYTREFSGFGPLGVMNLDDWHLKRESYLRGELSDELKPISKARFDPAKSTFLGSRKQKRSLESNENMPPQLKRSNTLPIPNKDKFVQWTPQYRSFDTLNLGSKLHSARSSENVSQLETPESSQADMNQWNYYEKYNQQLVHIENLNSRNSQVKKQEIRISHSTQNDVTPSDEEEFSHIPINRTNSLSNMTNVSHPKQVNLLQLKQSFHQSDVRKQYFNTFPHVAPDLRDHIDKGKKHYPTIVH